MQGFGGFGGGVSVTSIRLDRYAAADDAFAQFYRAEHDLQVRRAYLMLGDRGAAHDVVAAAFVVLYQWWDTIERPGPYLNRCVLVAAAAAVVVTAIGGALAVVSTVGQSSSGPTPNFQIDAAFAELAAARLRTDR